MPFSFTFPTTGPTPAPTPPTNVGSGAGDYYLNLINALCAPVIERAAVLLQWYTTTQLDLAVQGDLDKIGELIGQSRQADTDQDYRRKISARIAVNRSQGRFQDLIRVTKILLANNKPVRISGGGKVVLLDTTQTTVTVQRAQLVFDFISRAVQITTRLGVMFSSDPANDLLLSATDEDQADTINGLADNALTYGGNAVGIISA
jgi:hypothetical protein